MALPEQRAVEWDVRHPSNVSLNPANVSTYPERLTIQAPTDQVITMTQTAYTGFMQDKWHVSSRATLTLGLRYDVNFTPLNEANNPAFSDAGAFPVDKNNLSPGVGLTYTMDGGRSLIRTGWGFSTTR
jgi:outer membrane receptor protein involved in Fe transport